MGWVDPSVGLGRVGSGWVEIFQFVVGLFLLGCIHYSKSTENLKGLC